MSASQSKSAILTFGAKTVAEIDKLKAGLGANSLAEVVQKALGLAKLAVERADPEANVTIGTADTKVDINLKT